MLYDTIKIVIMTRPAVGLFVGKGVILLAEETVQLEVVLDQAKHANLRGHKNNNKLNKLGPDGPDGFSDFITSRG